MAPMAAVTLNLVAAQQQPQEEEIRERMIHETDSCEDFPVEDLAFWKSALVVRLLFDTHLPLADIVNC